MNNPSVTVNIGIRIATLTFLRSSKRVMVRYWPNSPNRNLTEQEQHQYNEGIGKLSALISEAHKTHEESARVRKTRRGLQGPPKEGARSRAEEDDRENDRDLATAN